MPAIPSAPATGRDLLPAPVWIEVCACERPGPSGRPTPVRPHLRPAELVPPARVALTVRFCAFLI